MARSSLPMFATFDDFVMLSQGEGRQTRGDGLGLSISRKVARQMGGELRAQSKQDQGSTFVLTLPLERLANQSRNLEKIEPSRSVANVPKKSILIVEDNPINRSVLSDMIVGFGHSVNTAANGLEAIKICERENFDLIIMDISMPFMDGIEATRRIRETAGPNQSTRILGLTAHGREEHKFRAQEAGMSSFFTKPIRMKALQKALDMHDDLTSGKAASGELIDDEVFSELHAALGDKTMQVNLGRFFEELSPTLKHIDEAVELHDKSIVSDALHKLRGSCVLLGLAGIASKLDDARLRNDQDDRSGLRTSIDEISAIAAQSKDDVEARLKPNR